MVWLLAGVPSILGIKCWSVWGGGCFNSTLQYPARVDCTGIRARTPHAMLLQRAALCCVGVLWFGCWRVSHLFRGSDVGAFGGGGCFNYPLQYPTHVDYFIFLIF